MAAGERAAELTRAENLCNTAAQCLDCIGGPAGLKHFFA
jgi:hypothetical protein